MYNQYRKESLIIVAELVERGFLLQNNNFLKKNNLTVWVGRYNVSLYDKNNLHWINYRKHQSINKVLALVDGYLAWNK